MTTRIYASNDELPNGLMEDNFFHSPTLFQLSRQTPRHRPYMVTVEQEEGFVVAQMLALVRYRSSFFPPYFYMHCRVLGEGAYADNLSQQQREELFGLMVSALKTKLNRRILYIEVSHLSQKMFAYRTFRQQQFFPVRWMSIHNSLHSAPPAERLTAKTRKHIDQAMKRGVTTSEVSTEADFQSFMKLLRHHHWLKPRRYVPHDKFFQGIMGTEHARLFVSRYKGHAIGCSAVAYSQGQAYLWYAAYRRKTFGWLHPAEATIWHALEDAYQRGYQHMYFLDVGLPFRKNPFREFILRFGGKPASTYRWFYCPINWINKLCAWLYRE